MCHIMIRSIFILPAQYSRTTIFQRFRSDPIIYQGSARKIFTNLQEEKNSQGNGYFNFVMGTGKYPAGLVTVSVHQMSKQWMVMQQKYGKFKTRGHSFFSTSTVKQLRDDQEIEMMPPVGQNHDSPSPWSNLQEFKGATRVRDVENELPVPRETDVLVIGGGAVGSSVAFWLKQRSPKGLSVTLVERDPCYTQASSMLSVGGIRHQFSLEENILLSMFTTDFLRNIKEHLSVLDECPPDVNFKQEGYLLLATSRSAPMLEKNVQLQRKLGAKIELLSKGQLTTRFPWLNTTGIEVGSHGLEGEGWFDPWLLVKALKQKNISLGVKYVTGELEEFQTSYSGELDSNKPKTLVNAIIRTHDSRLHGCKFAMVVNCAGPWAAEVAQKASIGRGEHDDLVIALPVEPRKRFVYVVHCPNGPTLNCGFTIDPSGIYFRREGSGGHYLCGASPNEDSEPDIKDLDVDYEFFDNYVWPQLAKRVTAFEGLKVKSAWAGYYDYNFVDQNLVIGNHPYHTNFFFANGLSGHGLQHSVAVGHALMEYIIDGKYKTVDLSRFGFKRFLTQEFLKEEGII